MIWLWAACADPAGDTSTLPDPTPATPTDPSAPVTPTTSSAATDDLPPVVPLVEIEAGLTRAVELAMTLDAAPVVAAYDAVMMFRSQYCPYYYNDYGAFGSWGANCEAATGAVYAGAAFWYTVDVPGYWLHSYSLYASVITPDGWLFSSTGGVEGEVSFDGVRFYEDHVFSGTVSYDGPEAAGTWLGDGLQPSLYLEREAAADGPQRSLYIDGAVSGIDGLVDTVDYIGVTWDSIAGCAEPTGTISTRTADGTWFDIVYDATCDGCGTVTWRGTALDTACADFTPWETLEVTP